MKEFADKGNEFLQVIDGQPAEPPPYNAVNPSRSIRFPVYEYKETRSKPPSYEPAVEECTVVSVKWEWSTPYELSSVKHWHNYLMEINSTQLNFYEIDPELTQGIKGYSNGVDESQHSHHLFSLAKGATYQFNKTDQEKIVARLQRDKSRYLNPSRIWKSFSLQCARLGIPTDYTKKTFVLRMRCEQEQFMINFSHVDDMIMWSVYLQTGIYVSLDLDLREFPDYRIVPRRRAPPANDSVRRSNNSSRSAISTTTNKHRRPAGPQKSHSTGKIPLYSSAFSSRSGGNNSAASSNSGSGSTTPTPAARIKPQRSTSSGLLPTLHKRHSSSSSIPQLSSSSASRSHSTTTGEESPHSVKSKFKHLFKGEEQPPKLVSSRSSGQLQTLQTLQKEPRLKSSPSKKWPKSSTDLKAKFHVGDLNSVKEDVETENQNSSGSKGSPLRHSVLQRPGAKRMASSPLLSLSVHSLDSRSPPSSVRESPTPTPTPTPPNESSTTLPSTHSHREAEEVQQVRREHNDPVMANLHDEIRASFAENNINNDNDYDDNDSDAGLVVPRGNRRGRNNDGGSVYLEEGIFHENDDDYIYIRRPQSNLKGKDGKYRKWNPPIKELSRGRYIRDCLRCIRPLNDDDSWMGKVVLVPHRPPKFLTNNAPLSYGITPKIPNLHTKTNPWEMVDYKRTRNHYLRPYIVGPTGLMKAVAKSHNIYEEV